jgi:tight adherence protein B
MVLLGLVFLIILFFTFGVIALMMRPTAEEKTVDRRMANIKTPQNEYGAPIQRMDEYLVHTDTRAFVWLDGLLEGFSFSRGIKLLILRSDSHTSEGAVVMAMLGLVLTVSLVSYYFSSLLPVSLASGVAAGYIPIIILKVRKSRRIAAFDAALADCVEICGRSLRAGHSLITAIGIVAEQAKEPAKTEFGEVFKKQNYGLEFREALMQMLDRVPSPDLRVMITGMLVQKETGGNLAELMDRIASVIRERIRIKAEVKTQTAQGRLTGWILCLLPVFMLVVINVMNPGYSDVMFHNPMGQKLLYVGIALLAVGAMAIRHIINRIEV